MDKYVYKPEECTEVIEFDISDEKFLELARAAHKMDITINHFINLALHETLNQMEENGNFLEEPSEPSGEK